jgi:exopolysaccharide biosynthesis protein
MVVDGRQKGLSMGMSYEESAHFMKTIGCTDAINLDGGGSSTFWLNGKVVNSPSDKHERSVANSLVILQHQPGSIAQEPLRKASN